MATLVSTPTELDSIRNDLYGSYELANDIDLSNWGNFEPLGEFNGTLDGKGYKISNLYISADTTNVGLFNRIENEGIVSNLGVVDATVKSNGNNYVGIITGYLVDDARIKKCYSTGTVEGQYGVGGLVGYHNGSMVEQSYSHAAVTGKGRVGGLVGNLMSSFIDESFSTGKVTVTPDPTLYNGGLVGSTYDTNNTTKSYYDTETSNQTTSAGGIGKTTSEMKTQSTYTNWDFSNVWSMDGSYPYLTSFC